MASEPPSPSGQGPVPRAVVRTAIRAKIGVCHFFMMYLSSEVRIGGGHPGQIQALNWPDCPPPKIICLYRPWAIIRSQS